MGAALGGGIAALQKKDIAQGALMGGIGGALGGAFMPAAGAAGTTAAGAVEATAGTLGSEFGVQGALGSAYNPAVAGATNPLASDVAGIFAQSGAPTTAFPVADVASIQPQGLPSLTTVTPTPKPFEIGSFLTDNKYALAGGVLGGMMAPGEEPKPADEGNIQSFDFDREANPLFGQPGQPYYIDKYKYKGSTPAKDFEPSQFAAEGGIVGLAEGGNPQNYRVEPFKPVAVQDFSAVRPVAPAVQAYNQQIMERANQQYNINPRPAAMQVPGSAGYGAYTPLPPSAFTKPADTGIGGLRFDPVTGRYTGTFEAPNSKKSDFEKMREELDALKSGQNRYNETGGGDSGNDGSDGGANGSGEGWATGGLMQSYAMGGDIGASYQSPDDMGMGDRVGAHQTVNMAPHYPMQGQYQGYADGGHLGDYSDGGRLLKGPGDGVSDDIPAQIGARQPARLADGEFVVPARIVSELGNGSTDAGAKRLYAMMDRVQNNRRKSIGKGRVAVDSKAYRNLPA
jgi:hypothetical protein